MEPRTPCLAAEAGRRCSVRVTLSICLVTLTAPISGCYRYRPVSEEITTTHQAEAPVVRSAVVRALATQRFDPEHEVPGWIYARMSNGKWMIRVAVHYGHSRYAIHYVDSSGLRHRVDRNGRHIVHHRYHRVVDALSEQIRREIGPVFVTHLGSVAPLGATTTTTTTTTTTSQTPSATPTMTPAQPAAPAADVVVIVPARP